MRGLLEFFLKLYKHAGYRLPLVLWGMMVISLFESFGLLLLIPLLGLIGLLNTEASALPLLSELAAPLNRLPEEAQLPTALALFVAVMVLQALLQRAHTLMNMKLQHGFIRQLRQEIYGGLIEAGWSYFAGKRRSDFHHILSHELSRATQGVYLFMRLITTGLFTLMQVGFALWVSPVMTLLVLVCGLLLAVVARTFVRKSRKVGEETTALSEQFMAAVSEHFDGIKEIKSNRLERQHYEWFEKVCKKMEANYVQFARVQASSQLFYKIAAAVLIAGFVYVAFAQLRVPQEKLLLLIVLFTRLWPRFTVLQGSAEQLGACLPAFASLRLFQQESAAAQELSLSEELRETGKQAVTETPPLINGGTGALPLALREGLTCEGISYRYRSGEGSYALHNIHLFIPANRTTALVGHSGAGKSTFVDVLIGLLVPEQGRLLADGVPITRESRLALRSRVSYVGQEPFLFHASLRDNLLLVSPGASDEELWEALRFAASDGFVRALPEGLDTVLGDRGLRLSGGERQRIVLARAILRKPSILVLDEATSALDHENEARIQEALERLRGQLTIIVIAHRLSTICHADQIVVMAEGEIHQRGSYSELSNEPGLFRTLLHAQHRRGA